MTLAVEDLPSFQRISMNLQLLTMIQAKTNYCWTSIVPFASTVLELSPSRCEISNVLFRLCSTLVFKSDWAGDFLPFRNTLKNEEQNVQIHPHQQNDNVELTCSFKCPRPLWFTNCHMCAPSEHKSLLWGSEVEFHLPLRDAGLLSPTLVGSGVLFLPSFEGSLVF